MILTIEYDIELDELNNPYAQFVLIIACCSSGVKEKYKRIQIKIPAYVIKQGLGVNLYLKNFHSVQ